MHISNVRRGGGRPVVAWFDLYVDDGNLCVIDMYLKRNSSGELRAYAPSPNSRRIVTFNPAFAEQVANEVNQVLGGRAAHVSN